MNVDVDALLIFSIGTAVNLQDIIKQGPILCMLLMYTIKAGIVFYVSTLKIRMKNCKYSAPVWLEQIIIISLSSKHGGYFLVLFRQTFSLYLCIIFYLRILVCSIVLIASIIELLF